MCIRDSAEAVEAIGRGIALTRQLAAEGYGLVATGEMGIGLSLIHICAGRMVFLLQNGQAHGLCIRMR